MAWRPLLDGEHASTALVMARELALDIAEQPGSPIDRTIFWAYASNAFDEPFAVAAFDAAIGELVAHLARGPAHAMLFNDGLCGVGWALAHVVEGDSEELLAQIDAAMLKHLAVASWRGDFDLSQGLAGYAVYFLERMRTGTVTAAREGLARIVAHLAATAIRTDDGAYWHTGVELLPEDLQKRYPQGRDDFGLAHGLAGVIAALARIAALPDPPPGASALAAEATRFMIAQRQGPTAIGSRFPALLAPEVPYEPARAAWCYGDLGIAFALWTTAPELARETALDCATRPRAHGEITDCALCHGSGGLGHLYNRLAHASGDPRFADAARAWFELTLLASRETQLKAGRHLVDGSAGTALALIAATSAIEPSWDRLMVCDLRLES